MRKRPNIIRTILTMLAVGLVFLTWTAPTALADGGTSPDDGSSGYKYPDDSKYLSIFQSNVLVVKMYPQFSAIDIDENLKVSSIEQSLAHSNTYLVKISGDANAETTAADLAGQAGIAYAHPNYTLNALHPVQGSIPFSDEVHIGSFEGQTAVNMTNLVAAHSDATGDQITVGVIDGGIEFSHPALQGKAVSGWDFVDNDDDAYDEPGGDASGHGTFVAGLVHLVAPDATIRAYRVMDENGFGDGFTLAQAIERAVDDGCDVINLSVVLTHQHLAVQDAINYATSIGVIVVAAAGNDATDAPVYPAAESNVIAVAALDTLLHAADFTNYGSYIDVCAPGVGTYSAYQGDLYAWWDGTSFAAPFVAGEAALLRQDYPTMLAAQIKAKILASAQSVDSENPTMYGELGNGLIDPSAALAGTSGSTDTASIIPDTLFFTHIAGIEYFVVPELSALLLSSNAPAAYSIQLVETVDTFAYAEAGSGMTNDSVYVAINPGELAVGEYFNKFRLDVDGVDNPVYLVVGLDVIPEPPVEAEAHFTQSQISFTAQAETDPLIYGAAFLTSSNAPAAFTAEESGYYNFVTLQTFSGTTNDSVSFEVDPGKVPGPGLYIDTILCWVDGVTDPAKLLVQLTVDGGNPQPDTVIISPLSQSFEMVCYTLDTLVGYISIGYNGAPHRWIVSYNDTPDFLTFDGTAGYTNDSARFVIRAGSLEPGDYTDQVAIYIEGLTPTLLTADVHLHVQDSSEVPSPVFLSPPSLSFTVAEGSTEIQSGCTMAYLWALNPPPIPNWHVSDGAFADVVDTTGTIYDSICIEVDPSGFAAGSYTDSIIVTLDGYYQPAVLPVNLLVESTDTTFHPFGDSLVLTPPGGYYISRLEGSTEVYSTCATMLSSSDGGALSFTGTIKDGGQFTELYTTSGVTPDSICFSVDPTGFTLGDYVDTLIFTVAEYEKPAIMAIHLYVGPADTVVVPDNSLVLTPWDLSFTANEGATDLMSGCAYLWNSDSTPAPFTGYAQPGARFTDLLTTSGMTFDSVCVEVDPTGFSAGTYYDSVYFDVDGFEYPAMLTVRLDVIAGSDTLSRVSSTLSQNYPNPFNPTTTISFNLSSDSHVTLDIYNVLGRKVTSLVNETLGAGEHAIQWDASTAASGIYFYRFNIDGKTETRKMILLR